MNQEMNEKSKYENLNEGQLAIALSEDLSAFASIRKRYQATYGTPIPVMICIKKW